MDWYKLASHKKRAVASPIGVKTDTDTDTDTKDVKSARPQFK